MTELAYGAMPQNFVTAFALCMAHGMCNVGNFPLVKIGLLSPLRIASSGSYYSALYFLMLVGFLQNFISTIFTPVGC